MNKANINTYFGAKWNVQVCKFGDNGLEYHYPLGENLKNNMILDHWLEGLTYLYSPSGGAVKEYCNNGLSLAGITRGTMHIGAGSIAPAYNQTGLQTPLKSTSYIRPFFNQCTGIYYPESGMAVFSRNYDFGIENSTVTYAEAGFRPGIADSLPTGKRNWLWSRFVFTQETGVSGYIYANSGIDGITGMDLSGIFLNTTQYDLRKTNDPLYSGFSGLSSFDLGWRYNWPENSGMFLLNQSGNTTGFVYSPKNITQLVTGFISGYLSGGSFYPFSQNEYPSGLSGFSGIYIQDNTTQTLYFESGGFNGFDNFTGVYFNIDSGFIYSGFDSGYSQYGSGFLTTQGVLTGSMTGIIGSRNILKLDGYITGIVGFRNIIYPITLTTGEFLKIRYDVYMQIPAIVNPIPVTGENIVHGEFNGTGQLKLIGRDINMFGLIDGDGRVEPGIGVWWPIHKTHYSKYSMSQWRNLAEPNAHLSALMVASGFSGYNDSFPPMNSLRPLVSSWLDDEIPFCDQFEPQIGKCGTPPQQTTYWEEQYYSSKGMSQSPPWPLYSHSTLRVNNYIAHNRPTSVWPKSIDIQMIFPGPYPNQDTGINGFIITSASEQMVCGGRTISDAQGNTYSTIQYQKPKLYENIDAYADCGIIVPYVAWYYKFDNPQIKYEDQVINLYLTFSLDRINV